MTLSLDVSRQPATVHTSWAILHGTWELRDSHNVIRVRRDHLAQNWEQEILLVQYRR
jgi:hypothetical protein